MFATGAMLVASQQLLAQDTAGVSQLKTVVVTATKFDKEQGETGKVLTIIGRDQIDRSAGRTVADLLNEQAGIVINGVGSNPSKDRPLYFRGATQHYTTILIDGIPTMDATGAQGNAIDIRLLPIDGIERIEILRGTQSTLYGADAIAGVINIIMKKGSGKPFNATGQLSWGTNRSIKTAASLFGQKDNVDYNITFTRFETDGISEAAPADTLIDPKFDKDGYKQNALIAKFGIQATEQFRLQPFLIYSDYASSYDGGAFQDRVANKNKSNMLHTGVRGTYDLGKGQIQGNFGYQKIYREYFSGTMSQYEGRSYFGEVYGHYDVNNWLQALVGVEYRKSELLDTSYAAPYGVRAQYSTSPYASLFIRNLKGFSFEAGARYTMHSQFGNNFTFTLNPSYLLSDQLKLFANISSGFKSPTLTMLYGMWGSNPDLKAETANSYEAGVQAYLLGDKIDLRVVAFKRDLKNVVQYFDRYMNFDRQNDRGLEAELALRPAKGLHVKVFYTYVEGEVTTTTGAKDTTYNNLTRRPNHTGGLNIGYQLTPKLFVSSNLRHVGTRNDLYFPPWPEPSRALALQAYTLWDMYAEYRFAGNSRIFFNANNITNNRKYWEVYGYSVLGFNMQAGVSFQL